MRLNHVALLGILSVGALVGCEVASSEPASEAVTLAPPPHHDGAPTRDDGVVTKAVRSVPAIDTSSRAAVVSAYNTYFNVAMPDVGFTGNAASCTPGSISLAFQEWTVSRINFLRAMAGVPGSTTLNTALNEQQQAAALIMAANQTLSHAPTSDLKCYTATGFAGAQSSNLSMGSVDSIPAYMSDYGPGNHFVGHRRWVLHARKSAFSLGQAAATSGAWYSALQTFQTGPEVSVPAGIPWPPRGHVPLALFPSAFSNEGSRWSFGLTGASVSFASANVTVTKDNAPLAITVKSRTDDGFGDRTIVWELPVGHLVGKGEVYRVTITGVTGASSSTFSYDVFPFDPADPVQPTTPTTVPTVRPDYGSPFAVTRFPDNRIDLFGRGADNSVQHKPWAPTASWDARHDGLFFTLGSPFSSAPTAVSWAADRIDLFALDQARVLRHRAWTGASFSHANAAWESLGGVFTSPPAVAAPAANRLEIFGLGTNRAMFHKAWNGSSWVPSVTGWTDLGGVFNSPPAVTSPGATRVDVFGLGTSNDMFHRAKINGAWEAGWRALGGTFISPPAAVSPAPGRVDVFGLGTDGALFQKTFLNNAWTANWVRLGGSFQGPPAAISSGGNRIDVFALGRDTNIYHRSFADGAWAADWTNLGGGFIAAPVATVVGPDQLNVFGLKADQAMYHKVYATYASGATNSQGEFVTSIRKMWTPSGTDWARVGGNFVK